MKPCGGKILGLKEKLPLINSDNKRIRTVGYIAYAILGLMVIDAITPDGQDVHKITGNPTIGFATIEDLERINEISDMGDTEGALNAVATEYLAGRSQTYLPGDLVYIEDTSYWSGHTKVRRQGDPTAYWIESKDLD